MKFFKYLSVPLACFIIFIFARSLFPQTQGHVDTIETNAMDGAWLNDECYCEDKKTIPDDMQVAHTLFVNGHSAIQQQTGRWKKAEWNKYCSVIAESTMKKISENSFEVTQISGRSFSPGDTKCDIPETKKVRTWTIISKTDSQLRYESSTGCEKGPMICQFSRLDR